MQRSQISNGVEVLKLSACGYTDRQIGAMLFIAPETIRSRMKAFYRVVRAKNRHHALAISLAQGWLTANDLRDSTNNLRPKKDNEDNRI